MSEVAAPGALTKKLGIKPGHLAALLNAPEGAAAALEPLPAGATVETTAATTPADVVVVFVENSAAVEAWVPQARAAGKAGGLLWVVYPKGGKKAGTDLNRDILWELLGVQGLTGVTLVAYDGTWSAMRFRPTDEVGAR